MQRRDFVKTACMMGVTSGVVGSVTGNLLAQTPAKGDWGTPLIELRRYRTTSLAKRDALIEYATKAMLPALKRLQCEPVGLLTAPATINDGKSDWENDLFVLFTNSATRSVKCIDNALLADEQFMQDAAEFYAIPYAESLYQQCEAVLMAGFPSCPGIETPVSSPDRVFQLRYYQSYNVERNAAKIAMFEDGGELALFRECGLYPVFFGATLYGALMPNLTYMVGFENEDAKKKSWDTFIKHPLWDKMKNDLKYKETATTIVNINLRPCEGSQI